MSFTVGPHPEEKEGKDKASLGKIRNPLYTLSREGHTQVK